MEKYNKALVELPKLKGIRVCVLKLQGCKLSDKKVKLLLQTLLPQRKMETLELLLTANNMKKKQKNIHPEMVQILSSNPHLREFVFDFSVNNVHLPWPEYFELIKKCKLEKLSLGMCGLLMNKENFKALTSYIGNMPTLRELRFNFRYNEINDEDMEHFAEALSRARNLELLHLQLSMCDL